MGNSAISWAFLALLGTHFCTPVLSSVHTLYTSNFHNVSELYTLQFDDETLEFNVVDTTPADGPMVWLDFDVSTRHTLLNEIVRKDCILNGITANKNRFVRRLTRNLEHIHLQCAVQW